MFSDPKNPGENILRTFHKEIEEEKEGIYKNYPQIDRVEPSKTHFVRKFVAVGETRDGKSSFLSLFISFLTKRMTFVHFCPGLDSTGTLTSTIWKVRFGKENRFKVRWTTKTGTPDGHGWFLKGNWGEMKGEKMISEELLRLSQELRMFEKCQSGKITEEELNRNLHILKVLGSNVEFVDKVEIELSLPGLIGMEFVDCPGTGEKKRLDELSEKEVKEADVVFWVSKVDRQNGVKCSQIENIERISELFKDRDRDKETNAKNGGLVMVLTHLDNMFTDPKTAEIDFLGEEEEEVEGEGEEDEGKEERDETIDSSIKQPTNMKELDDFIEKECTNPFLVNLSKISPFRHSGLLKDKDFLKRCVHFVSLGTKSRVARSPVQKRGLLTKQRNQTFGILGDEIRKQFYIKPIKRTLTASLTSMNSFYIRKTGNAKLIRDGIKRREKCLNELLMKLRKGGSVYEEMLIWYGENLRREEFEDVCLGEHLTSSSSQEHAMKDIQIRFKCWMKEVMNRRYRMSSDQLVSTEEGLKLEKRHGLDVGEWMEDVWKELRTKIHYKGFLDVPESLFIKGIATIRNHLITVGGLGLYHFYSGWRSRNEASSKREKEFTKNSKRVSENLRKRENRIKRLQNQKLEKEKQELQRIQKEEKLKGKQLVREYEKKKNQLQSDFKREKENIVKQLTPSSDDVFDVVVNFASNTTREAVKGAKNLVNPWWWYNVFAGESSEINKENEKTHHCGVKEGNNETKPSSLKKDSKNRIPKKKVKKKKSKRPKKQTKKQTKKSERKLVNVSSIDPMMFVEWGMPFVRFEDGKKIFIFGVLGVTATESVLLAKKLYERSKRKEIIKMDSRNDDEENTITSRFSDHEFFDLFEFQWNDFYEKHGEILMKWVDQYIGKMKESVEKLLVRVRNQHPLRSLNRDNFDKFFQHELNLLILDHKYLNKPDFDFVYEKQGGGFRRKPKLLCRKGAFGRLYEGRIKEKKVVVKAVRTSFRSSQVSREVRLMNMVKLSGLKHLAPLIGCYKGNFGRYINILMERYLCDAHDAVLDHTHPLFLEEREFTTKMKIFMFKQIASGLKELHGIGIVHRDIKPENILLGEKLSVFITDMGCSKGIGYLGNTVTGTPTFQDPFIFDFVRKFQPSSNPLMRNSMLLFNQHDNPQYTELFRKQDIFALGVTMAQLYERSQSVFEKSYFAEYVRVLYEIDPFSVSTPRFSQVLDYGMSYELAVKNLEEKRLNGDPIILFQMPGSNVDIEDLIKDCTLLDPSKRPDIDQVLERLERM